MIIQYTKAAQKAINSMDSQTKQRIRIGIEGLTAKPPIGDIKRLKGNTGLHRLRVGDYRILFFYPENDIILIEKIAPRGNAYKGV